MKSVIVGLSVTAVLAFVIGMLFVNGLSPAVSDDVAGSNVIMDGGRQIITIRAKGGYQPARSIAKAGVPTTLRFETRGTFDCSSILSIPSLSISRELPPSGTTDIDIGTLAQGTLRGSCAMGMYWFQVDAE